MKKYQWIAENMLLAIITALLLYFLLTLGGCYSYKKAAVQHGKAVSSYPEIGADYCARTYPVTNVTTRDTVTQYDTLWGALETITDTVYQKGRIDTIRIKEVRIQPKTVIRRFFITDSIRIVDKAALDLCNIQNAGLSRNLDKMTAEKNKYQGRAKNRLWLLLAIIGAGVGYLFYQFRALFNLKK